MAAFQNYSIAQLISLLTGETIHNASFYWVQFTPDAHRLRYPYRVQCYAVGLVQSGWLQLTHNLSEHTIRAGQLMIIAPGQIHNVIACSADFAMSSLFFTADFLTGVKSSHVKLYDLSIFQGTAAPWISLTQQEYQRLDINFDLLKLHYAFLSGHLQPLQYLLLTALLDMQQIHQNTQDQLYSITPRGRSGELVDRFLKGVSQHYLIRRNVREYAEQLAVSTKHLSETIKVQTGKPAGYWIDQMVLQEAQVLLRQTTHTVAEIAAYLHFSDQSAFGKFFRRKTGYSPVEFRNKP